jgi:hypothetical protein
MGGSKTYPVWDSLLTCSFVSMRRPSSIGMADAEHITPALLRHQL